MFPNDTGQLKCLICGQPTGRVSPQVCTKHFIDKTPIPIPKIEEPAPLYVSDKERKIKPKKQGR